MELDIEIKNTCWEQKVSENLQRLLSKRDLCDLKICTSDNQYVYGHLCIVTAFIPYLKGRLMSDGNFKEIYLSNVSQEVMQKIVAYCYGSVLAISAEQVGPLLVATDMLQMGELHDFLAKEQSKVLQANMAVMKKEPILAEIIVDKDDTVNGEAKNLELSYVVNDDQEISQNLDDEIVDNVEGSEESSIEHSLPERRGLRKRKSKVSSFAMKKIPTKKQKTMKAFGENRKKSVRKSTKGNKTKIHIPRAEKYKEEDACAELETNSPDLTESEDDPLAPLEYDQFVKEIAPEKFCCKVCKKVWPSKEKTLAHVPSHSEDVLRKNRHVNLTVQCVTCSKLFSTKSHLRAHIKDVHLNPSRKKVFNAMFAHLSPFHCPVCQKKFKWASDLKQHVLHHGERQLSKVPGLQLKYACDECRVAFITKVSYKSHTDMYHVPDSRYDPDKDLRGKNVYNILYQCDKCDTTCETLEQIEEHLRNSHIKGKDKEGKDTDGSGIKTEDGKLLDVDAVCNHVFESSSSRLGDPGSASEMDKIIKIFKHSDTSESDLSSMYSILVTCLKCNAKFLSVSEVREHKKTNHPSEKVLKQKPPKQAIHMCDLCGVRYKNNASRLIHMHVVHNIQFEMKRKKHETTKSDVDSLRWDCLYCSQRFRQRCGLRVHVVTHHTIEQLKLDHRFAERDKANYEYQCHLCKNKMKLYKSLQTHLRKFHGVRISKDSSSEYFDYDVAQKKQPANEPPQENVSVQPNVTIVHQEQINFEAANVAQLPKADLELSELGINPNITYQQPVPNIQEVANSLVQPYQTQDYVLLTGNTGLQLTFSGYPPVQ